MLLVYSALCFVVCIEILYHHTLGCVFPGYLTYGICSSWWECLSKHYLWNIQWFYPGSFSSDISLATVLTVLLTLTHNPTLLTLHARQQNPAVQGKNKIKTSAWIKALACALKEKLNAQSHTLQTDGEEDTTVSNTSLGEKLDKLSKLLKLYPYNTKGKFQRKLTAVSHTEIQSAIVVCLIWLAIHGLCIKLPKIRMYQGWLIKGPEIYNNTPVLTGECTRCRTLYSADHECLTENPSSSIAGICSGNYMNYSSSIRFKFGTEW